MRKFFLVASAAVSMFAVGCVSPESVCESSADLACDRIYECQSDAVKSSDAFKAIYGTSVADCKTKLYAASKCSERKEYDEACTDGKKYNLGNASDCSDARKAQTCADFLDPAKTPAVCGQICK
ncbi:hypothetical protein [Vitiosangium sp. GDMCC 1.1324]|uniref:hypothetical protein n=1 Tax=Vitiosangium sp. (strain GDMCC 1.1324) TaxID=2138576 RepID=UPI0011B4468E|nr:hypothetical protein [Vitiosangium sp. GDMCC 1.1324]